MAMRGARSSLIVFVLLATVALGVPAAVAADTYDDVPEGAYYADAVAWMRSAEITRGTSAHRFSPDFEVSTAQVATMLWRIGGFRPGVAHPYVDLPDGAYFAEAAQWSRLYGLFDEVGVHFRPGSLIIRADLAQALWDVLGQPLYVVDLPFVDVPSGHPQFHAISWMHRDGVTKGTTSTTFSPNDVVTRAQLATFLWRFVNVSSGGSLPIEPWIGQLEKIMVSEGDTSAWDWGDGVIDVVPVDVNPQGPALTVSYDSGHPVLTADADGIGPGTYRSRIALVDCANGRTSCAADLWHYTAVDLHVVVEPT